MKSFLIFVSGIIVGAGASYVILKNKKEEEINEAYREAREYGKNRAEATKEDSEQIDDLDNNSDESEEVNEKIDGVEQIINNNGYSSVPDEPNKKTSSLTPFIISPAEFGMDDDMEINTIYYYEATTDGVNLEDVLVDENNHEIRDVEDLLGMSISDIVSHYGEYEEGSVYIRNPKLNIDYEIVREIAYYEPN